MFRTLDAQVSVAPQISAADVRAAAGQGFTLIVNNRPDGEAPDEPQGDEIAAAARAAGIEYAAIPVSHAGFAAPQLDAMNAALDRAADGKVLAYCRSGTRSTLLWALAKAQRGASPDDLANAAAAAGYDLASIRPTLDALAARA